MIKKSNFNINYISFKENILYFVILFLPIFLILGNGVVNSFILLVTLVYIAECIFKKKILFHDKYEFKIFFIFYLYLIFNSLLSSDLEISLIRSLGYIKFFIFVLVYLDFFKQKRNLKVISFVWITILTLLNLDIIYQSIFGKDIFGFDSGNHVRNSGFFFDELVAGGYLLGFSFLSVFIFNYKKYKFWQYSFILFCFVACILSGERSNTIKFFLIFALSHFVIFQISFKEIKKKIIFIIPIILILISIAYYKSADLKERYLSTISFSSKDNISFIDKYLTSAYGSHTLSAIFIFKENFLIGVGNKSFRIECGKFENNVRDVQRKIDPEITDILVSCSTHPHQIYNELLSEHGIIGTTIIILLISLLVLNRLKKKNISYINFVSLFYILSVFIPILPSGSFFTTFNATIFWINFLLFLNIKNKK